MATTADTTRYEQRLAKLASSPGQAGQQGVNRPGDLAREIVACAFDNIDSRPGLNLRERERATIALPTT